jgi:hypothetical protein
MFALMCTGLVTGLYVFVGAWPVVWRNEPVGAWGGIAGLAVTLITAQKGYEMLRALTAKASTAASGQQGQQ